MQTQQPAAASEDADTGPHHHSLEFHEGKEAYADGIDGYAATPYTDGTQPMTDWFAGWLAARNADRELVAT